MRNIKQQHLHQQCPTRINETKRPESVLMGTMGFRSNLQIESSENNRIEGPPYLRTCRTFKWNFAVN